MRMMRVPPFLLAAAAAAAAAVVHAAGGLDFPALARRQVLPLPPPLRDATADLPTPAGPSDLAAPPPPGSPSPPQPPAPNAPPPQPPAPAKKGPITGSPQPQQQQTAIPADPPPGPLARPKPSDALAPDSSASSRKTKEDLSKGNSTSTAKPTPSPTAAADESSQSAGSNTGLVLGGVLGGLAAVVAISALGYRWRSSAARRSRTEAVLNESKMSPEFKLKPEPDEAGLDPVSPRPRGSLTPLMHGSAGSGPSLSLPPPNNTYASYGNGAVPSPPNSGSLAPLRVMNNTEQGRRPAEDEETGSLSGYPPSVTGPRPYPSPLPNEHQGNNFMGPQAPSNGDTYSYAFADRPRPRETPWQQQNPEVYHNGRAQPPMLPPVYGNTRAGPFQQQQLPYQSAGRGSHSSQGRTAPYYPGPSSYGTPYNRDQQGRW